MDRRTKVELFEQIRREYEQVGGTIRGVAKKLGFIGGWCVRRCSAPFPYCSHSIQNHSAAFR